MACRFCVTSRAATTAVAPIASPAALASFDPVLMGLVSRPAGRALSIASPACPTRCLPLPTRVRIGYGSGSVATGAFGTVPGLMLLPYLTDSLGIAALAAGLIVLLPKAWDVVLNPIAGRISDRTDDPRGPRRPWLLRAGLPLAVAFALIFAAPELGSRVLEAAWVLVFFLAAASAYAFFQVPYVAMPAEITASYDERTRLMTWRVAILAFTIMLAGATAPVIRDAVGGRAGYRVMGVVMAAIIVVGVVGAYVGTRSAPIGRVEPGAGSLRDQLRIVAAARDFRLLLTTYVVQALATGCMLAGVDYLAEDVLDRSGATTILFVCFVGPALAADARVGGVGRADRQAAPATSWRRASSSLGALAVGDGAVGAGGRRVRRGRPGRLRLRRAARSSRWRCCRTRRPSTRGGPGSNRVGVYTGVWTAAETLGLALGPGLFALVLAIGGYESSTDRRRGPVGQRP